MHRLKTGKSMKSKSKCDSSRELTVTVKKAGPGFFKTGFKK